MEFLIQLDGNILLWIQKNIRQDWWDGFWLFITSTRNVTIFLVAISIIFLIFKKTRALGIVSLCSLGLGFLICNIGLKNIVNRPRPYTQIDDLVNLVYMKDPSFPSGHATAAFSVACTWFRMLPKKYGIGALIVASFIAFSRLYVGVHYPSDILCGILIGMIGSWLVYRIYLHFISKETIDNG